jgi:hypothetical protein
MRLFDIDENTKLPIPTAEARTIKEFNEIIKRLQRVDGDADGRKKTRNIQELAYIHYSCVYDSRFKLLSKEDRDLAIKKLIGLPDNWQPDSLVLQAMVVYRDLQWTESIDLVHEIQRSIAALTSFSRSANDQLPSLTIVNAKEVKEYMDILDRIPSTVDKLKKAKELLHTEQEAISKGIKGRKINKFERP